MTQRPLALVTGASSGIGFHLAQCCVEAGFDLVIASDEPALAEIAQSFRAGGIQVEAVVTDLATTEGVDELCQVAAATGRPVDALLANAGHGLGHAFLDQNFTAARHVIDTNITGTLYLIYRIGHTMRDRKRGRILITGSVSGYLPGAYQAIYNGTKAFLNSFSFALRNELKSTGVTVTCLMPGPTETHFFERAGMLDTKIAQGSKDHPADVAQAGFDAMMRGDGDIVTGWKNKLQTAVASVTPSAMLAELHRSAAQPGSGEK